jgi:hypothetical protein
VSATHHTARSRWDFSGSRLLFAVLSSLQRLLEWRAEPAWASVTRGLPAPTRWRDARLPRQRTFQPRLLRPAPPAQRQSPSRAPPSPPRQRRLPRRPSRTGLFGFAPPPKPPKARKPVWPRAVLPPRPVRPPRPAPPRAALPLIRAAKLLAFPQAPRRLVRAPVSRLLPRPARPAKPLGPRKAPRRKRNTSIGVPLRARLAPVSRALAWLLAPPPRAFRKARVGSPAKRAARPGRSGASAAGRAPRRNAGRKGGRAPRRRLIDWFAYLLDARRLQGLARAGGRRTALKRGRRAGSRTKAS